MKDRRTLPRFMQLAASEFLLPGFLWLWMLISGVGLVVALLALAGRTAAGTPPAPTWAYAGAAAAYLLLLVSTLGILREKEAGVPGFLLASVLLYLLNVVTGAPVGEAIRIFVGVIVLLLLLRLDDWQEPDAARIEEGCRAALEAEESDSAAALEMYEGLAEQNRDVSPGLVALGALTMPGAFLLAQWLSPRLPWSPGLTQTLLLALIGVGPIVWLFGRARSRLQQRSTVVEGRGERIMTGALVALAMGVLLVVILFSDLLTLAISAIIASLLSLVLVQPYSLYLLITQGPPYHVLPPMSTAARNAIGTAMLLLVLLVVVSDVRLKPIRRALGELGTALQTNWEKIVSFLAALVMLFAFSSTFAERAPFALDVRSALILQALSGALLGYAFSVQVYQPVLDVLIRTGQARCLGATGRRARGLYVAFRLLDSIKSSRVGAAYKWLVSAQIEQLEEQPDPGYVANCVSEARKQASDRLPYAALFADALERAAGQALGQARPRDGGRATQAATASHGGRGRP
jgi:hypothetical protein